jgi:tRNA A37 threonylcarbamoyladenosine synthetase subunit TsaC/SUA5/YrdC
VQQLRRIKQRPPSAPIALALADVADVQQYCAAEHLPPGLLAALLPGPVTVLLPRRQDGAAAPLAEGVFSAAAGAGACAAAWGRAWPSQAPT